LYYLINHNSPNLHGHKPALGICPFPPKSPSQISDPNWWPPRKSKDIIRDNFQVKFSLLLPSNQAILFPVYGLSHANRIFPNLLQILLIATGLEKINLIVNFGKLNEYSNFQPAVF
jgi:hypothetical protein